MKEAFENYKSNIPALTGKSKHAFFGIPKNPFFNKLLNKGLRVFKDPKEAAFLRLPFSDVFLSIYEIYQKNIEAPLYKEGFTCYRGCKISEEEFKKFETML